MMAAAVSPGKRGPTPDRGGRRDRRREAWYDGQPRWVGLRPRRFRRDRADLARSNTVDDGDGEDIRRVAFGSGEVTAEDSARLVRPPRPEPECQAIARAGLESRDLAPMSAGVAFRAGVNDLRGDYRGSSLRLPASGLPDRSINFWGRSRDLVRDRGPGRHPWIGPPRPPPSWRPPACRSHLGPGLAEGRNRGGCGGTHPPCPAPPCHPPPPLDGLQTGPPARGARGPPGPLRCGRADRRADRATRPASGPRLSAGPPPRRGPSRARSRGVRGPDRGRPGGMSCGPGAGVPHGRVVARRVPDR